MSCSACKVQNCFPDRKQCVMTYWILPVKEVLKWHIKREAAPALHGTGIFPLCAFCYLARGHPERKADKKVKKFSVNTVLYWY